MKLEMKDTPGQLVTALTPISEAGGNIIAIVHQRDATSTSDTISVQVVLELSEKKLHDLIEDLQKHGIHIQRIGKERLIHRRDFIIIGHIVHTDLSDTVDQIDQTGFAEVSEIQMVMPGIHEPSTARIMIKATNAQDMQRAAGMLRTIAARKDILVIEPVEENQ
jgi:ACT domain-containing protein